MQRPGDVMFVPSGYWHTVLNLAPSVAITHNFASAEVVDEVRMPLLRLCAACGRAYGRVGDEKDGVLPISAVGLG
jgi:hypothetical protein